MVRSSRFLKSVSGFSLIELVVAMAVSIIVSGVAVFAFVMTLETYTRMVRQYEAETEMVNAIMAIRSSLSSAVNVDYCGTASSGNNSYTARVAVATNVTRGCVYDGVFNSGVASNDAYLFALVLKDMNVDYTQSKMYASALFFQRPSDSPRRSGAIYIDQEVVANGPNDYSAGWVKLSPVNAPFMFTRFTEFRAFDPRTFDTFNNNTLAVNTPIMSIRYRLTMRYYTKGHATEFRWFPASGMGPYNATAGLHYDLSKEFKVNFTNNSFDRTRYLAPRAFGNLHLFKYAAGQSRKN